MVACWRYANAIPYFLAERFDYPEIPRCMDLTSDATRLHGGKGYLHNQRTEGDSLVACKVKVVETALNTTVASRISNTSGYIITVINHCQSSNDNSYTHTDGPRTSRVHRTPSRNTIMGINSAAWTGREHSCKLGCFTIQNFSHSHVFQLHKLLRHIKSSLSQGVHPLVSH